MRVSRRRRVAIAAGILALVCALALAIAYVIMIRMPSTSFTGELPALGQEEKALARSLERDVNALAADIGPRHAARPESLERSVSWLKNRLERKGLRPERYSYEYEGETFHNVEVEVRGREEPDEIVVLGAHYDTVPGSPGADDNASGVAALVALAGRLSAAELPRTVRYVFFANEEQPFFQSEGMGSLVYAKRSRAKGDEIAVMVSLESIGYFDDAEGSQSYPPLVGAFYPSRGNFLGFVGNLDSRGQVREAIGAFRRAAALPSEGAALPSWVPGVGWSDHWAFWQAGYPAIMVTGTAPFRNPHYHMPTDTPDTLDYARLARAVIGLDAAARALATPGG